MKHTIFITALLVGMLACTTNKSLQKNTTAISDTITLKSLLESPPKLEEVVYKQTKDTALKIYYSKPIHAEKGKKYPAIVWIHGGGWTGGDARTLFPNAQYFSYRNAVGFSIEYRLVKFHAAGVKDCMADCKSAIRFIRENAQLFSIDPNKLIVLGESAGGHLAACLGTIEGYDDPKDNLGISAIPNAMILYNPCIDMTLYPLMKNILKDKIADVKRLDSASIAAEDWNLAKQISPINHVKANQPPCLLIHGTADKVIPWQQSQRFYDAMKKAGNTCELILLPDLGHAFAIPKYKAPEHVVVQAITDADIFLTKLGYLNGSPLLRVSAAPAWPPRK